ncbi:MAG: hypothetical protein GC156_03075 [Actinomycetales bacterium]|nr:hypothetical protein [Actinomycetales bacterium]
MKRHALAGTVTAAVMVAAVAVPALPAQAAGAIPVVDIAVSGNQATISQTTMRPGVVEFHVGDTFPIPEQFGGGTDTISIVRTDALDQVMAALPGAFGEDPAAAAQAMRTAHALSTWYGGGHKGDVWQVYLPPGNYYALGVQSTVMQMAQPVAFTVAGQPRSANVHAVQAAIWATGPVGQNQFRYAQLGRQPVMWFAFRNNAHEIHFLDLTPVKPGTTTAQVKKSFMSDSQGPPSWVAGEPFTFDVVSPGVRVAIKHSLAPGKYLADCFIPSETDGMPHALMGMYKLVIIK